jgi:hypothetical protein
MASLELCFFFLLWVRRRRFRGARRCGGKPGWAVIIYREFHRRLPLYQARSQILEGRLITRVCVEGTINSSDPRRFFTHSCAHRRSSQPPSHLRLDLRSQMFRKLWLAYLSSLQTFLNRFSRKFSTLALVARLASALVLQIPETPTSGGQITIKWTNEPNDPYVCVKLSL